jgi:glutaredoxin/glutathione-dependent peroxiredoxin
MSIAEGEKLPAATLMEKTPDGPAKLSTDELFAG